MRGPFDGSVSATVMGDFQATIVEERLWIDYGYTTSGMVISVGVGLAG